MDDEGSRRRSPSRPGRMPQGRHSRGEPPVRAAGTSTSSSSTAPPGDPRSALQALAGLEHGLEAADHHHPALTVDAVGRLRRALELVVRDRPLAAAATLRLDLPGHAARFLLRELRVVERLPAVDELAGRVELE